MRCLKSALTIGLAIQTFAAGQSQPGAPFQTHDFGRIMRGAVVSHSFPLRNGGQTLLRLKSPSAMSPGLRINFPPVVPPGEERSISMHWNTAAAPADAVATVNIGTDDPTRPELNFALRAKVVSPIEIQPGAAYFSVYEGVAAEQVLTIRNQEDRPLRITGLTPQGTHFRAELRDVTPGKLSELHIRVPAGTEAGRFMEAVQLQTDHPSFSEVRIPVNVLVKKDVYVFPDSVEFGSVDIRQLKSAPTMIAMLTQTFLLKARQGTLEVLSLNCDVPGLQIKRAPASGPSAVFRFDVALDQSALVPKPLKGTITIRTSDPRFPVVRVPVSGDLH